MVVQDEDICKWLRVALQDTHGSVRQQQTLVNINQQNFRGYYYNRGNSGTIGRFESFQCFV